MVLEIVSSLVGGEGQDYCPFAGIRKERRNRILSHIRGDCHGIERHLTEDRPRVHLRSVADIAPLCVGNNKNVGIKLVDITNCLVKRNHPPLAV